MERMPTIAPVPEADVLPLGGRMRERPEDFQVEELPLYPPTGEGEHLMLLAEKRGLTTPMAAGRLARGLGVPLARVGWAGYKDRHAVTRQWFTLQGASPAAALALELEGVRVLEAHAHRNKLRPGHLRGNAFLITLRGCDPQVAARAPAHLRSLAERGLPNGFGPQRFGVRLDNHLLGEALLRGDALRFLELVGTPDAARESPRMCAAREAMGEGRFVEALELLPGEMQLERQLAVMLRRRGGDVEAAVRSLPPRPKSLFVSAWQSECFDRVLAERMDTRDRLLPGDVAMKHGNGACFLVADAEGEVARARSFEISPTGPLPGDKLLRPREEAGALEERVLAACSFPFERSSSLLSRKACPGARRALRVPLAGTSCELPESGVVVLGFELPKGSFATALLRLFGVV